MKLPLAIPIDSRNGRGQYDARPVNVLKESSATGESVVKRPALVKSVGPDVPANGNGLVDFNGSLISVFGATLAVAKASYRSEPPKDIPVAVAEEPGILILDDDLGTLFHMRLSANPATDSVDWSSVNGGTTWNPAPVPIEEYLTWTNVTDFCYRLSSRSISANGKRLLVAPRLDAARVYLDVYEWNGTAWEILCSQTSFFTKSTSPLNVVMFDDYYGTLYLVTENFFEGESPYSPGVWTSTDGGASWTDIEVCPWTGGNAGLVSSVSDSDSYDGNGDFNGFTVAFCNPANSIGKQFNPAVPDPNRPDKWLTLGLAFLTTTDGTDWKLTTSATYDLIFGDSVGAGGKVYALALDPYFQNYIFVVSAIDPVAYSLVDFNECDAGFVCWSMALHKPTGTFAVISIDPSGRDPSVWLSTSINFGVTWSSVLLFDDEYDIGNYKITAIQGKGEAAFYLWASNGNKLWKIAKGGLRSVSLSTLADGSFDFVQSAL